MTMLVIVTQYKENYGDEVTPYWKFKGGNTYKVLNTPLNIDYNKVIKAANIEYSNPMSEEYVIEWFIEGNDYSSQFEKDQLEYDGKVTYPDPVLQYSNLVEENV